MTSSTSRKSNRAKAKAKAKTKTKTKSKGNSQSKGTTNLNDSSGSNKSQSARKSAAYYANNAAMLREKAKLRMRNIRASRAATVQPQAPAPALNQDLPQDPEPTPLPVHLHHSPSSRSPSSSPLPEDLTRESSLSLDLHPSRSLQSRQLPRSPSPDLPPRSRSPSPTRRSRQVDDRFIDPRLRLTRMELDDCDLQGVDLDLEFDLTKLPYEFDIQFDHFNLSHNADLLDHFDPEDEFWMVTHRRCVGEWASRWGHTSCWAQEIKCGYHRLRTERDKEQFVTTVSAHALQGRIIVHQLKGILDMRDPPKEDWHLRELWRTSMELLDPMYRGLGIIDAWLDFLRVVAF